MRRREFTALLGGAALPVFELPGASAQQAGRIYRVGFLVPASRASPALDAFFVELRLAGFIEGQNLTVIPGGFDIRDDRVAEQAAALVKAEPDAIVCGSDLHTRALQKLTGSIPLIGMTEDMVGVGLVASLARPGGNTTGISLLSPALDGKRQDILIEAVPGARHMAALADSRITTPEHLQALQEGAQARGVALSILGVAKPDEIGSAIHSAKASGAEALNVLATPLFFLNRRVVIEGVATVRLPAIYQWPDLAEEGGLLGYGPRLAQLYRQRARMVIKILRGTKPADIPVEQPTLFELVVNLKTAKAIGHEVPHAILQRADKVIE
jgi:putative tryptophan/tyrosine transport system substrate-binding protein